MLWVPTNCNLVVRLVVIFAYHLNLWIQIAFLLQILVETTLGFVKDTPSPVCGFNVYHKNRLIRVCDVVTGENVTCDIFLFF